MIIALHQAKHADNLANVVRTASAYGIEKVSVSGPRMVKALAESRHRVFRHRDYKSVEIDLCEVLTIPYGYTPIAIEIVENAQSLPWFEHPDKGFYIFGPEDGDIPSSILRKCHHIIQIPMKHCINLSHAVSTVMYDRMMKNETAQYRSC